jgi:mono/diheme cytochrome c family protein
MTGDQCLFCHRNVVGPTWEQEPHAWTIRPVGVPPKVGQLPADATHIIGSPQHYRALKLIGYGKFAILGNDGKTWQPDVFATKCAGCHTTGVDPAAHTFSAFAFDCYACHGDLGTDHTTKPEIALLGTKHAKDPKEIVAICGQCHLRGGRSQSSGLPYPNNFIGGDDLLADFKVDLSRDHDPNMNPADRHAYTYTRNVMEKGSKQTCLECHRVHGRPELKHEYCVDCDELPASAKAAGKLRSETCLY